MRMAVAFGLDTVEPRDIGIDNLSGRAVSLSPQQSRVLD